MEMTLNVVIAASLVIVAALIVHQLREMSASIDKLIADRLASKLWKLPGPPDDWIVP
jgi:uncharacterized membrane protein